MASNEMVMRARCLLARKIVLVASNWAGTVMSAIVASARIGAAILAVPDGHDGYQTASTVVWLPDWMW